MKSISFFNAFLRSPSVLFNDNQSKRAPLILSHIFENCPSTSMIGLCEVWKGYEDEIIAEAKFNHNFFSISDSKFATFQNSGLCLLYDPNVYRLLHEDIIPFRTSYLLDIFARKSFLVATFKLIDKGTILHVILTHLNDVYGGEHAARRVQYEQMIQIHQYILCRFHTATPYIIMGDFNIDVRSNVYQPLSDLFTSLGNVYHGFTPTYKGPLCPCSQGLENTSDTSARVYDYIISSGIELSETTVHIQSCNGLMLSDHCLISRTICR